VVVGRLTSDAVAQWLLQRFLPVVVEDRDSIGVEDVVAVGDDDAAAAAAAADADADADDDDSIIDIDDANDGDYCGYVISTYVRFGGDGGNSA
jgi:hypothetical protein